MSIPVAWHLLAIGTPIHSALDYVWQCGDVSHYSIPPADACEYDSTLTAYPVELTLQLWSTHAREYSMGSAVRYVEPSMVTCHWLYPGTPYHYMASTL